MADASWFLDPAIGAAGHDGLGHFTDAAAFDAFAAAYDDGMALLPAPDDVVAVPTASGTVRGYRFGTRGGTPLVLLSGRQASTPMWRANIAAFTRYVDVWSLDSVGEPGASTQVAPLRTAAECAAWVDEALAGLPAPRVHLLGVSIGGWLATQTAIHRPDRLASAILLDPAVTFARLSPKMVVVSLGSVVPWMPSALRHRLLGWISGGVAVGDDVPEGRLIAAAMRGYTARLPAPTRPSAEHLRGIGVPVLALIAGESIAHDAQAAAAGARAIPGAEVVVWPGASHAINGEFPDEIAQRVHAFTTTRVAEEC